MADNKAMQDRVKREAARVVELAMSTGMVQQDPGTTSMLEMWHMLNAENKLRMFALMFKLTMEACADGTAKISQVAQVANGVARVANGKEANHGKRVQPNG